METSKSCNAESNGGSSLKMQNDNLDHDEKMVTSQQKFPIWSSVFIIIFPIFMRYFVPYIIESRAGTCIAKIGNGLIEMIGNCYAAILIMIFFRTFVVVLLASIIYTAMLSLLHSGKSKKIFISFVLFILCALIIYNITPTWSNISVVHPIDSCKSIFQSINNWFKIQITLFSIIYIILNWTVSEKLANKFLIVYFMIVNMISCLTINLFTAVIGLVPGVGDMFSAAINIIATQSLQALVGSYILILGAAATIMQYLIIRFRNFKTDHWKI